MSVVFILLIASLLVATGFLVAFFWAVRSGQFEDTATPAMRVLNEDEPPPPETPEGDESKEQA